MGGTGMMANLARGAVRAALDAYYRHSPAAVAKLNDVVAKRGEGSWVWTSDGRKFLDFASGIGVTSTGHCHPKVVSAVQAQAATVVHAQQNVFGAHERAIELAERLHGRVISAGLPRFFFCNSGAEAVDNAVKVARAHTGRPNVIVFEGGYHGRTIGSMALTTSKTVYRAGFGPLMPGVFVAPYPNCLHCGVQKEWGRSGYHPAPYVPPFDSPDARRCCGSPIDSLQWMLQMQTAPSETAAVILEPVLGEGGFLTPPPGFLRALRQLCTKHGIMLIADEVQSGAGRTGTWWGYQQFDGGDMDPDLIIFAKGIASGYPFAGLATRADAFDKLGPGTMGGTYGGNAVSCAAAVATIDVIESEGVLQNVAARGEQLMKGLVALAEKHPDVITDVRGRGLMVGVEFAGPKGIASALTRAAAKRDVLLMTAGARETVRFLPCLTVTEPEVDACLGVVAESLAEALGGQ